MGLDGQTVLLVAGETGRCVKFSFIGLVFFVVIGGAQSQVVVVGKKQEGAVLEV